MIHLDFAGEPIEAAVVQVQFKAPPGARKPCERRGAEERG